MTKPILVIQHEKNEGPGYIADWAKENKIPLTVIRPQDSLLPQEGFGGVILLGGMMNICDSRTLPWLTSEIEWVKQFVEQPTPVLGICLGAQILAHILGAEIHPLPQEEMGWLPIRSAACPCFSNVQVFHAHSYYFEIPEGARRLAESDLCAHQAFLFGKTIMGLQFHLEWSKADIGQLFPDYLKTFDSPEKLHLKARDLLFKILNAHFIEPFSLTFNNIVSGEIKE
ncbi:hypothetical protein BTJ40_07670 [Microbulbifer sp. A4B17]|uniref:type 1 glutamine amidotransferase n=1 Tax=Microbulbifer sp. A4B17 TaxID=359370 RepID=UPI000D52D6BE|nr:type 1 glutamine amidotransferase [Microbulbifer sp. A4B17]AWF80703.1 hypothetical protein BTJ40_07670 [Microbulbifer sp. A4B17]